MFFTDGILFLYVRVRSCRERGQKDFGFFIKLPQTGRIFDSHLMALMFQRR